MLRRTVIGLQPAEAQVRGGRNHTGELHRRLPRLHAAAVRADVDLHQHVEGHAELAPCGVEGPDVTLVVRADRDTRLFRERGQALHFMSADDFIRDEDVADAACDERFGFAHFLAAHADRTERDLARRDLRTFMAFGVRADFHRTS
jgi:hypothetical protein